MLDPRLPYLALPTLAAPQAEAAVAASTKAGLGRSSDIAWDEAVSAAMSAPPEPEESPRGREARVLKSVLEAGIVPDGDIEKVTGGAS